MENVTAQAVAEWAGGTLEEWLPGYLYEWDCDFDSATQYWICQLDDGTYRVHPNDKSGPGRRFRVSVSAEELT